HDPSLKPVPFDPVAAGALLTAAGWTPGPDGIRVKNGKRLSLQIAYGQGSPTSANIVVQTQQMLKHVGVEMTPKSYAFANLFAAAQDGGIFNAGNFDLALYSWISGGDPDNSSAWLSTQIPPGGNNVSRYRSPEMDALQGKALSTFDRRARADAYAKIEALLLRDAPGAFLYNQGERHALTPALKGFTPNGINAGWNAYQWSI
ncbi:MAG: ABC transporter substrate-binding protein, partial [Candidatus Eremiobacteraeota bacterium]|nr:ABC transporter substrate-binding protein [Candidatus Eremiobacteraeota bacterium]